MRETPSAVNTITVTIDALTEVKANTKLLPIVKIINKNRHGSFSLSYH